MESGDRGNSFANGAGGSQNNGVLSVLHGFGCACIYCLMDGPYGTAG